MVRMSLIFIGLCCTAMSGGTCAPQPTGIPSSNLNEQLDGILARLPTEVLGGVRLNDGAAGGSRALFGLEFEQGFTTFVLGDTEAVDACLLVDDQGPLVQQEIVSPGTRIVRFATGDAIVASTDVNGLLFSIVTPATEPPSVFAMRVDLEGQAMLLLESSTIGTNANAAYGTIVVGANSGLRSAGVVEAETCAAIAEVLDRASSTVCETLSTSELMTTGFAVACQKVGEFLEQAANDETIDADTLEIVQSAISFTCRGGEIILTRGRFFSRLSPIDWFCTALQVSQEIAVLSTGRPLGEVVCDFLRSECPSGQVLDTNGICVTVEPPATIPVPTFPTPTPTPGETPPPMVPPVPPPVPCAGGSRFDEASGKCLCSDGSEPDPQTGCPCPDGQHRNQTTGECEDCPPGSFLFVERCELPPNCCISCAEARTELDGVFESLSLRLALLAQAQAQCMFLNVGCEQIAALEQDYARESAYFSRLAEHMADAGCFGNLPNPSLP